jgi:hypothetical protein
MSFTEAMLSLEAPSGSEAPCSSDVEAVASGASWPDGRAAVGAVGPFVGTPLGDAAAESLAGAPAGGAATPLLGTASGAAKALAGVEGPSPTL